MLLACNYVVIMSIELAIMPAFFICGVYKSIKCVVFKGF